MNPTQVQKYAVLTLLQAQIEEALERITPEGSVPGLITFNKVHAARVQLERRTTGESELKSVIDGMLVHFAPATPKKEVLVEIPKIPKVTVQTLPKKKTVRLTVREVLIRVMGNATMSTRQIYDAMRAQGTFKENIIYQALYCSGIFERVSPGMYRVKSSVLAKEARVNKVLPEELEEPSLTITPELVYQVLGKQVMSASGLLAKLQEAGYAKDKNVEYLRMYLSRLDNITQHPSDCYALGE